MYDAIAALGTTAVNTAAQIYAANKQQQYSLELMKKQAEYNREATDYQTQKEKEMFNYTSYPTQVRLLKEAGLNPGLIYSHGGSGGVTGSISAPQVSQPAAPNMAAFAGNFSQGLIQGVGMAMQLAKLQSEIKVNETQAQANAASATKQGAETKLTEKKNQTEGFIQASIDLDNSLKGLELSTKQKTQQASIDQIIYNAQEAGTNALAAIGRMRSLAAQGEVDEATIKTKIEQTKASLNNTLADIILKGANTYLSEEQAKKASNEVVQKYMELKQNQQKLLIDEKQIQTEIWKTLQNNGASMDRLRFEKTIEFIKTIMIISAGQANKAVTTM